jgi:hypothetical protein
LFQLSFSQYNILQGTLTPVVTLINIHAAQLHYNMQLNCTTTAAGQGMSASKAELTCLTHAARKQKNTTQATK